MSVDESSDDYFEASPIPTKRRRLNGDGDASYGSRNAHGAMVHTAKDPSASRHRLESICSKKSQKKKHLVHVHSDDSDLEDTFHSQLSQLDSSPWRVRGARWIKQEQAKGPASSPLSAINEKQPALHNGSVNLSESLGDREIDAQAFAEAVTGISIEQNQSAPCLQTSKATLLDFDFEREFADLPSDAFESSLPSPPGSPGSPGSNINPLEIISKNRPPNRPPQSPNANVAAPKKGLQQMTLFGDAANQNPVPSQHSKVYNWPLASRDEPATHHRLNQEALKTYVYPTNLGTIRDYQYSIVKRGLYHNLLVALPTGLGKTFIAATIMLNWYRWTEEAQIVFIAPTKPLVAQQVEACFRIAGIPRSHTTMLTGGVAPGLRAEEWSSKRVFFMTPQTIINDLKTGICDPKRIVLLVVDEAHRATGSYAYVEVVKFVRRFNQSFRVLALTATPGNSVETVQEVINGLDISRVEIRTEFSIDIRQYVHNRNIEQILFSNSEEMEMVMSLFSKALQPVLNKLRSFNAFWSADPMQLTPFALTKARQAWFASPAGRNANAAVKGMLHRMFAVLASLAHNIELLKFHGIGPFYHNMVSFQSGIENTAGNKYEKEIAESNAFREMMRKVGFWVNHEEFIGHPKLDYLQGIILNHFSAAGEGRGIAVGEPPSSTRIMIFAHFRDSAEEIVRVLKRHEPMIRPHVFVGQAASKGSEGMDQKRQLEIIQKFKTGVFNTLVATSIGEEGLDIGEIDLIICYDSSSSPIRMLQRMGRTGRKRAGNIVLLLMKGKEGNAFIKAKDNYEKMQQMIADAKRFNFHDDRSRRIVPKDMEPVVDKRTVEIPVENTQADFLPEPKKRGKVPKRPPKKFHMPDGVRTGFVNASRLENDGDDSDNAMHNQALPNLRKPKASEVLEPIPPLSEVLLTKSEEAELHSRYQDIQATDEEDIVIGMPNLSSFSQFKLAPVSRIQHCPRTERVVKALKIMSKIDNRLETFKKHSRDLDLVSQHHTLMFPTSDCLDDLNIDQSTTHVTKDKSRPRKKRSSLHKPPIESAVAIQDVTEGISSSPLLSDPRLRIHSQGISLGSDTSGEDPAEADPSSELRDFVVDDDSEENPRSSSDSLSEHGSGTKTKEQTQSIHLEGSQQSVMEESVDSSLPDLRSIIRGTRANKVAKISASNTKRSRRVIEDSSD